VQSLVRNLDAGHVFSRTDILAVFQSIEKDGVVSKTDFTDLQTIVANPTFLGTPGYVEDLANKVVNGNLANASYQGTVLGNLTAGCPGSQLTKLVDKWFLGTDHPQAMGYTYAKAAGNLFGMYGPFYTDIHQGLVGDCFLMASLSETALRDVTAIKTMFIDNGDQTWTVRFYVDGQPTYVTVDRYLPASNNQFVFANYGASVTVTTDCGRPLWVALAEKAYVELNETGVLDRSSSANSYAAIDGGYVADALAQITGQPTHLDQPMTFTDVVSAWNSGKLMGFGSKTSGTTYQIVGDHAYALVGYNAAYQTFTVFNPWGLNNGEAPALVTLTWSQIVANFSDWDCTA
jgi:hypothetical protein